MKGESTGKPPHLHRCEGKARKGQLTLEILIALGILTVSLVAAVVVIFGAQSASVDAGESNKALYLARAGLEAAEAAGRADFNSVASSSSTQGEFLKEMVVENVDAATKRVTSRVSWQTDPLRPQKVELVTLVTNWNTVETTGGDTGGSGLTGNWKVSQILGAIDLGPGNAATGLDVKNKIVYLSAQASDTKKPDFFVVDATNGQSPRIISSLNTGPSLNAVDVAGTYAYVANNDTDAQLQLIDVSNIGSPILVKSFELSGVSGAGAVGNTVFYCGGKVYVGTKKASGPEFHVIDVSAPSNPVEVGSFDVGADVNGISVSGSLAYLATSDDNAEVKILDVSNPAAITQVGSFNAPGGNGGKSVYVVGSTLYLGRTGGSSDFMIVDVSNPAAPGQLSIVNLGGASVNGIVVRDYLAFLATSDPNKEFQVWNIASSTSPTLWSAFNFPQVATGIDYEDNLVYVSVRSNDALRIITSQ